MIKTILIPVLWSAAIAASAQTISTVSSRWSDSFVAWDIYISTGEASDTTNDNQEELYGEMKLRWLNFVDDFSEWTYDLGGHKGTIRQKWKTDRTQWELRTYEGDVITMRTAWPNDMGEWRVTDNNITLQLHTRWKTQLDEWLVDDQSHGRFYIYTLKEGDPRDWAVEDKLDETISEPMKMALLFLAIYQSTPKQ